MPNNNNGWFDKGKAIYGLIRRGVNPATGKRTISPVGRMPMNALMLTLGSMPEANKYSEIGRSPIKRPNLVSRMPAPTNIQSSIATLAADTVNNDNRSVHLLHPLDPQADLLGHPADRALKRMLLAGQGKHYAPGEMLPGEAGYVTNQGFINNGQHSLMAQFRNNPRTGQSWFGFKRNGYVNPNASNYIFDSIAPTTAKGFEDQQSLNNHYLKGQLYGAAFSAGTDALLGGHVTRGAIGLAKLPFKAIKTLPSMIRHPINTTAAIAGAGWNKAKQGVQALKTYNPALDAFNYPVFKAGMDPATKMAVLADPSKAPMWRRLLGASPLLGLEGYAQAKVGVEGYRNFNPGIATTNLPDKLPLPHGRGFMDIPKDQQYKAFDFSRYPVAQSEDGEVHLPYSYNLQDGRQLLGEDWYQQARAYNAKKTLTSLYNNMSSQFDQGVKFESIPDNQLTPAQLEARNAFKSYALRNYENGNFIHRDAAGYVVNRDKNGNWARKPLHFDTYNHILTNLQQSFPQGKPASNWTDRQRLAYDMYNNLNSSFANTGVNRKDGMMYSNTAQEGQEAAWKPMHVSPELLDAYNFIRGE